MTKYIKAPFNFVPLSEEVYFPNWADKVSQDVPFSDGESACLNIKITAHSPIYVGNGTTIKTLDPEKREFSNYIDAKGNKQFFIPGSSMKGMIRNIVEIMSFGKLDRIDDNRYAVRDFKSPDIYTLMKTETVEKIMCGWLSLVDGSYVIDNCGKPRRISHSKLDENLGTNFVNSFKEGGTCTADGKRSTIRNEAKYAKFKYENVFNNQERRIRYSKIKEVNGNIIVGFSEMGDYGDIILTGQASARLPVSERREKPSGKFYEFVFPAEKKARLVLSDTQWEEFRFQYYDNQPDKMSIDWKYWKEKLNSGEKIPVFFRVDEKQANKVKDFGLSYLYKMPYENTVKQSRSLEHAKNKSDLSDLIFGYISTEKDDNNINNALKGRVQFGHALAKPGAKELPEVKAILGSPKASYFPLYIKQTKGIDGITSEYDSLMDKKSRLSGWKRYPVHTGGAKKGDVDNENKKIYSYFKPLAEDTVFEMKLRFHNLRKVEIGALLSALTFHKNRFSYHNLGMAKALGYGKVKLEIQNIDCLDNKLEEYLKCFEEQMCVSIFNGQQKWNSSEQIKELIAMTSNQCNDDILEYMPLDDFPKAKGGGSGKKDNRINQEYLQKYTELNKIDGDILPSVADENDIIEKSNEYKKEQQILLEKQQKRIEAEKLLKEQEEIKFNNLCVDCRGLIKENHLSEASLLFREIKNTKLEYSSKSEIRDIELILDEAKFNESYSEIKNCILSKKLDGITFKCEQLKRDFDGAVYKIRINQLFAYMSLVEKISIADNLLSNNKFKEAKEAYLEIQIPKIDDSAHYDDEIKEGVQKCNEYLKKEKGINWDKCTDFKQASNNITPYLKKTNQTLLPDNEAVVLNGRLLQWYEIAASNKRTKREFTKTATWDKIAKWVGQEKADKWRDDIIKE